MLVLCQFTKEELASARAAALAQLHLKSISGANAERRSGTEVDKH